MIISHKLGIERGVGAAAAAVEEPKLIFFYGFALIFLRFLNLEIQTIFCSNSINSNRTYELTEAVQILRNPKFNRHSETVLYLHGYVESPASSTVQLIANAYIKRKTHNILVLDWSALVNGSYITAVANSKEVNLCLYW